MWGCGVFKGYTGVDHVPLHRGARASPELRHATARGGVCCLLWPRGQREACAAPQLLLMIGLSWFDVHPCENTVRRPRPRDTTWPASTFPSYRVATRHGERRRVLWPRGQREACAAPQLLLMMGLSWFDVHLCENTVKRPQGPRSTFPSYRPRLQ